MLTLRGQPATGRRGGLTGAVGLAALALVLVGSPARAQTQTAPSSTGEAAAAQASALRLFDALPREQCPADNPTGRACLAPVPDAESLSRGIAKFQVTLGPAGAGSALAALGRQADGNWGYWLSAQEREPELLGLPGTVLACSGARGGPAVLLTNDGPVVLAALSPLRVDRFVLTRPGLAPLGDLPAERGGGWYRVSGPLAGWVAAQDVTDPAVGDCSAQAEANPLARAIGVAWPRAGAAVGSPFEVRGRLTATPFENSLLYRVLDEAGNQVGSGRLAARGEPGRPGTFSGQVAFQVDHEGPGRLEIVDQSPAGTGPLAGGGQDLVLSPPGQPAAAP